MKASIVGVGRVGASIGLVLVARQLISELVLVGRTPNSARGEAIDLAHASAFGKPARIIAGGAAETFGSAVVVLCLSTASAFDPAAGRAAAGVENWRSISALLPALVAASPDAVFLIATNPVDAIATLVGRHSGLPPARVIGTGTLLDTMRLRVALSQRIGIHPADIRAYVLGEHGDTQFAALSAASAGGAPVELDRGELAEIERSTREVGHDVVRQRGYTNHGIALAAAEVIEAVLRDTRAVMPVAGAVRAGASSADGGTPLPRGDDAVWLSRPSVIGRAGIIRTVEVPLDAREREAWARCAASVARAVATIEAGDAMPRGD